MENNSFERWVSFENPGEVGPFIVLIKDIEWWDENRALINEWFDRNCPETKPDNYDTMIWFKNKSHYFAWKITWNKYS